MNITEISYSRLVNTGNLTNRKVGAEASLGLYENPANALSELKVWVDDQLAAVDDTKLQDRIHALESQLAAARKALGGSDMFDDMPF